MLRLMLDLFWTIVIPLSRYVFFCIIKTIETNKLSLLNLYIHKRRI